MDTLGGLDRAIMLAKERAKIPVTQHVDLVVFPPRRTLFEVLMDAFDGMDDGAGLAALVGPGDRRAMGVITAPMRLFRRGEPLALMPFGELR